MWIHDRKRPKQFLPIYSAALCSFTEFSHFLWGYGCFMNIPGIFDPNCNSADAHNGFSTWKDHMDVSKNNGTSKSSIFIGFSIINHPFWGIYPYFWKHPHHSSHFSLPFESIWPFSEVTQQRWSCFQSRWWRCLCHQVDKWRDQDVSWDSSIRVFEGGEWIAHLHIATVTCNVVKKIVWLKFRMMRIWRRRYLLSAPPQLPTDRSRWVFPRGQIPQDLVDDEPDSTTWGNPWAFFPFGDSCPSTHFSTLSFQDHLLRSQNTHTQTHIVCKYS